ncbi:MAG: YggS family pyridoxal phosphate-dependent enzyme [Gemmatimonadaceae bacterium]
MPFEDLAERVAEVGERLAAAARRGGRGNRAIIVAVTKTHGADAVHAAWSAGIQDVAENRVQEAVPKMRAAQLPLRWHLIGHLQRNKVKHLDGFEMLQSLDSLRLADAVDHYARDRGAVMDVLVQVNASGEQTKGGFEIAALAEAAAALTERRSLRVRGVMTMAPYTEDERVLRATFSAARAGCDVLRQAGHPATELSMGMSNDYEIAVEEGATCVRLGTILFGARSS